MLLGCRQWVVAASTTAGDAWWWHVCVCGECVWSACGDGGVRCTSGLGSVGQNVCREHSKCYRSGVLASLKKQGVRVNVPDVFRNVPNTWGRIVFRTPRRGGSCSGTVFRTLPPTCSGGPRLSAFVWCEPKKNRVRECSRRVPERSEHLGRRNVFWKTLPVPGVPGALRWHATWVCVPHHNFEARPSACSLSMREVPHGAEAIEGGKIPNRS